jgi:predicted nucleic acid-binding protein
MKRIFADTFYWIAFLDPADGWHSRVVDTLKSLQPCILLTTEEVLGELLMFYSKSGSQLRERAAQLVEGTYSSPDIEVIEQTHASFIQGLQLYKQRLDKGYSLADCVSMNTMRQLAITEVLTHDKHFNQEGFEILLTD